MQLGKKSPIAWVGGGDNGGKNPMKVKVKMIGPAGQVAEVSLATAKAQGGEDIYSMLKRSEKLKKGWVVYDLLSEKEREDLIRERREAHSLDQAAYAKMYETQLDRLTRAIEAGVSGGQRPQLTDEQIAAAMTGELDVKAKSGKPRSKA